MPEKTIQNNVAYVIYKIQSITGEKPGKKTLQKMIYLAKAEGLDLGFDYGIHFYGPFSAALDSEVTFLVADNIVNIEYRGYSHLLGIDDLSCDIKSNIGQENEKKLEDVIKKYESKNPSELELLTTAHYVQKKLQGHDLQSIVSGVQKIKGTKYNDIEIKKAIIEMESLIA